MLRAMKWKKVFFIINPEDNFMHHVSKKIVLTLLFSILCCGTSSHRRPAGNCGNNIIESESFHSAFTPSWEAQVSIQSDVPSMMVWELIALQNYFFFFCCIN